MRVLPKRPAYGGLLVATKGILGLNFVFTGFSYYFFYRMTSDQEYRRHMYDKHPRILEFYYVSKEKVYSWFGPAGGHIQDASERYKDRKDWGLTQS